MNYSLCKYKNQWAIFCAKTRYYVLFGPKKRLEKRLKELNSMKGIEHETVDYDVE